MEPTEAREPVTDAGRFALASSRSFSFLVVGAAYLAALLLIAWLLSLPEGSHPSTSALLVRTLLADVVATVLIFLISVIFDNSSVYDPYWSVLPPFIYLAWMLSSAGAFDVPAGFSLRAVLILALTWFWGIRLTANWAIGWRGLQDEDWRYRDFRDTTGGAYWVVSFLAVHLFPTLAVFAGSLPVYFVLALPGAPFSVIDLLAVAVALAAILVEGTADAQMKRYKRSGKTGVMSEGLWKYSRHPNYLGEMSFWLAMLLFGVAGGAPWWTAAGLLVMIGIFFGFSIPMMERKILRTRPEYREVQRTVSLIIPWPPRSAV